jgi:3,4-dihydroxy 2-butanone 4-phosphate synthase / GTP cyclohydrolase II
VSEQVPIEAVPNPHNEDYLRAKRELLGHTLHHQGLALDDEMIRGEQVHDEEKDAAQSVADPAASGPDAEEAAGSD